MKVYLNGSYLPIDEAKISPFDRGFIFGDGIYEGINAYDGRLFFLDDHIKRLNRGLDFLGLVEHFSQSHWREIMLELLKVNNACQGTYFIYQQITRGEQIPRDHAYPKSPKPTVFITLKASISMTKNTLKGKKAVTVEDIRWQRCDIKSTSLLGNIYAHNQALAQGVDHAILMRHGKVTEAASSNIFIVEDGVIKTPPLSNHLLPGITRKVLIDLIRQNQLPFAECELDPQQVADADELFITGTSSEVTPITTLNQQPIGDGQIGAMSLQLFDLFNQLKNNHRLWS